MEQTKQEWRPKLAEHFLKAFETNTLVDMEFVEKIITSEIEAAEKKGEVAGRASALEEVRDWS